MLQEILMILRKTRASNYIREGRNTVLLFSPSFREDQFRELISILEKLHADSQTDHNNQ